MVTRCDCPHRQKNDTVLTSTRVQKTFLKEETRGEAFGPAKRLWATAAESRCCPASGRGNQCVSSTDDTQNSYLSITISIFSHHLPFLYNKGLSLVNRFVAYILQIHFSFCISEVYENSLKSFRLFRRWYLKGRTTRCHFCVSQHQLLCQV